MIGSQEEGQVGEFLGAPDAAQERAVGKLQDLHAELAGYAPHAGKKGWMARLGLAAGRTQPPRGLYMYGGVGRGKSMLMDLFFARSPVEERKQVHFHAFMIEVHERIYNFRQAVKAGEVPESADPLVALARVSASEYGRTAPGYREACELLKVKV